jgi:tight adherence protein B
MVGVALGLSFLVVGLLARVYDREERLADILDLPYGEQDIDLETVTQQSSLVENISGLAGKMVSQLDERGSLITLLEKARVPMRPGEFVVICGAFGIVGGALLSALTGQLVVGAAAVLATPFAAKGFLEFRINRRKKRFEEQFPDALGLIASSLSAGHTFLRSIQMMCQESPAPLSEEFARVVHETQLGDSLVDALERMGQRLQIRDVDWVVQAIRIQQTVGGKLSDLLHTLADFIRAREEVRREVLVLTAEGRISAYVLGGLPLFMFLAISSMNPGYMDPLFEGWGPLVLLASAAWAALGFGVILRMVKLEV